MKPFIDSEEIWDLIKNTRPDKKRVRDVIAKSLDKHRLTLEETAVQMAAATRRYARRQLTWLRKVRDAVIIDVQDRDPEEIVREIPDLALARRTAEESRYR